MSTYNLGSYQANITVDSSGLEKGLSNAEKGMDETEKKGSKMGKVLGGLALGAVASIGTALVGVGVAGFKAAQEFEKASGIIRAGTGATGEDLKGLEDSFKNVFKSVPQDSEEVATALADLNTRTGESGESLETLSKSYLDLSRISGEASDQLIESGSRGFEAWGIGAEESGDKMDNLWKIAQTTGAGVGDLMNQMDKHGATMRQAGMEYDDAATLMGNLEAKGYDADKAMSAFSRGIANIAKDGKDPAEVLPQIISEMENMDSTADATALAIETFGSKAGPEMAEMIQSGAFSIEELKETLANSSETIDKAGEDTLTLGERFQMLKDNAMVGLSPIGDLMMNIAEVALPMLQDAMDATFEFITGVIDFFREKIEVMRSDSDGTFSAMKETISQIMEAIGEVISVVLERVSELWDKYGQTIIVYATKTFENVKTVISGVLDVILGIVNTVLGILTGDWDKAWKGIKQIVGGVLSAIEGIISQALNVIETLVSVALSYIKEYFSYIWKGISSLVSSVTSSISDGISKFMDSISKTISKILSSISDKFSSIWNSIKSTVSNVVNNISSNVKSTFNTMKNNISSAFDNILSTAKRIFNNIKNAITNPITTARDTVRTMIDNIKSAFNFTWSLPKLKLPHVSVDMKKNNLGIPYPDFNVQWYRRGGFVDEPTILGAGEAGKEAIIPLVGRQMDPFADAVYNRLQEKIQGNQTTNNNTSNQNTNNNTYSTNIDMHINIEKMYSDQEGVSKFFKTVRNELKGRGVRFT
ncbi:phage tail tape measure protein [Bacillus solitudinis]|uniref:phage tail tape measure protein n=1 Tax=Bacillus solitudinis TaxID=2014074 RepID=UPI000C2476C3|nr:phage tail tape measure protein [Bacillus solitudinis]